tara:strand:- start:617 stop:1606 length:990 start_codon:yes stop_codon:yes gene_type:complete
MYNNIFIGSSLSTLFYIYNLIENFKFKDICIIEEKNKLGGSWYVENNKYADNIDTAGHLIVVDNNNKDRVKEFVKKKIGFELDEIPENKLFIDENSITKKNRTFLVSKYGYHKFTLFFKKYLQNNNIKIIYNIFVKNITIEDNVCKLYTKNKIFLCNKVYIPSYVKLERIKLNNSIIELNYNNNTSIHLLLYMNSEKIINDEIFHGFFNNERIPIDRVCFITKKGIIKDNTINNIIITRISKKYKDIIKCDVNLCNTIINFLKSKNIIYKNSKLIDFEEKIYNFYYRDYNIEKNKHNTYETINKLKYYENNIELLNTINLGSVIEIVSK